MRQLVKRAIHAPPSQEHVEHAPEPWVVAHSPDAWSKKCDASCSEDAIVATLDAVVEEVTTRPNQNLERYQLLHYERRQQYGLHHDYIAAQAALPQGPREFTVLFYLNDVQEGGETTFPGLKVTVRPRQGRVLLWPNVAYPKSPSAGSKLNAHTHHASLPVMEGEKFVATQWVHAGAVRLGVDGSRAPSPAWAV